VHPHKAPGASFANNVQLRDHRAKAWNPALPTRPLVAAAPHGWLPTAAVFNQRYLFLFAWSAVGMRWTTKRGRYRTSPRGQPADGTS
jgi:hypothetical protein